MKGFYLNFLCEKHILVGEGTDEFAFEYTFAMANLFGVRITKGAEMASRKHLELLSRMLGREVPPSFYRGFPDSVKKLTKAELFFDQLIHYARTYGFGKFDTPGYSVFEENFERTAFREKVEPIEFRILNEEDAEAALLSFVEGLLSSSRPLSDSQYELVLTYYKDHGTLPFGAASKNTAIRLLIDTEELAFAEHLKLSDLIKVCGEIQFRKYHSEDLCSLNLKNRDRKLLTALIHKLIQDGKMNLAECFEKKKYHQGLLHHLHFKPETPDEQEYLNAMRGRENRSVYATVERALKEGDVALATEALYRAKGSGGILRELNYLISRCENNRDIEFVLSHVDASPILLTQLYFQYATYIASGARTFRFHRYGRMTVHTENQKEVMRRRSRLSPQNVKYLLRFCKKKLSESLRGRIGSVYIDEEMYKIALPISEASAQGGFDVLPKGSRLPIGEGKKIRAFTYWEKVNDIDLSAIGIEESGAIKEFSWRTMFENQSQAITFSGDQTSGFNGGSEFYDIQLDAFREEFPKLRYIVFSNNVYSAMTFDQCICRAGYMLRDNEDSGAVFEPKTVKTSFTINANADAAYLFGIDLKTNELVWLNLANQASFHVAGDANVGFLRTYFDITKTMNVGLFFEMLADRIVIDPTEADVVLSTQDLPTKEGATVIRRYEFEKILSYLN